VPAHADTRVRLVYYQPLKMDLNVGRYLYPLAEGGVDEERIAFWEVDDRVTGDFSFHLTLKSAFPVKDIRLPGYDRQAQIEQVQAQGKEQNSHTYQVTLTSEGITSLSQDIIFYYRLDDSVPARIELIPYREHPNAQGTFMVVVTPAADLHPIREGTDWIFVLDTSGSMSGGKIHTLCEGMTRVLGKMSAQDRFRIITFNNQACDLTRGYVGATPDNVRHWIEQVKSIQAGGGTALFAGLEKAYHDLDDDRTTGVILVTDGVCNVGPTQHGDFIRLLRKYDLRLFTFVVGNSANQPLMTRLALESGGFAMNIADADDIIGRLIQAKTRVLHECMHDVEIRFKGENVHDLTPSRLGSLYIGQQAVVLGRYNGSGEVHLEMNAKISGQEKTWYCSALLPEVDQANPELERIWALSRIDEKMQEIRAQGETPDRRKFIEDMGIEFSLVTDYTSMLVVREDVFEKHDVERRNTQRVQRERQAQQLQAKASADNYRIDNGGTFNNRSAPGIGTGPVGPLFLILLGGIRHLKNRKNNA
jgi:Ca-activated chloride channel family protein